MSISRSQTKYRKIARVSRVVRIAWNVIVTVVCVAAFVLLIALGIGPRTGKYQTMTVLSDSMKPRFAAGDLIVVTPERYRDLRVGHVIAYKAPIEGEPVVTHRVVKIEYSRGKPIIRTRGDANNADDLWRAKLTSEPVWRQRATVPYVGGMIRELRGPITNKLLVFGSLLIFVIAGLREIWKGGRVRPPGGNTSATDKDELQLARWEDEGGCCFAIGPAALTRPARKRKGHLRPRTLIAASIVALFVGSGVAIAAFTSNTSASHTVTSLTVGTVGSLVASPNTGFPTCNSEGLSWTAAAGATSYKVEYQNNSTAGAWTTLVASTAALTYTDANAGTHLNATVNYRITPLHDPTWTGTPSIVSVQCGIGPVMNLAVSNQCTQMVLTFTTPYNNTAIYKVEYSQNGGAYVSLGNITRTGTSNGRSYYTRTAPLATFGTTYAWRVTPNSGTGSLSNVSNTVNWNNFHLQSVTNANSTGGVGTLDAGDTTVAAFSKTVFQAGSVMVNNNVTVAAGQRNMYLANSGVTTNNGLGVFINSANIFNNITLTGTGSGSWNASNTTYTWTEDSTTTMTQSAALTAGTWTTSTNTQCDPTPPELTAGAIAKVQVVAAPTGATTTFGGRW